MYDEGTQTVEEDFKRGSMRKLAAGKAIEGPQEAKCASKPKVVGRAQPAKQSAITPRTDRGFQSFLIST